MTDTLFVPIAESQYLEIHQMLERKGVKRSPISIIHQFIEYGLENAEWKNEVFFPEISVAYNQSPLKGDYLWKHRGYSKPLRLPHGTQFKMKAPKSDYKYAVIDCGRIKYEGKDFKNPSQLASYIANGTSRSAPRDIYIKLPTENIWLNAGEMLKQTNG